MTMRRLITYAAAGLVSAAALSACGSSAGSGSSGASSPYRVLALIALSGPTALDGKAEEVGVKAAVTVVNQHGGILGHPVALTVVNDNGDATTALTDVTQAIDGSSPPSLVLAGTDGAETDAVTPLLAQHKILSVQPTIATRSYSPSYAPYNFSDTATATALSTAFTQGAISRSGAKAVGLLLPDDALGTLSEAPEEAVLKQDGVKYYVATYPAGGTDFSPELLRLKSDNVQAVLATGLGTDAGTIIPPGQDRLERPGLRRRDDRHLQRRGPGSSGRPDQRAGLRVPGREVPGPRAADHGVRHVLQRRAEAERRIAFPGDVRLLSRVRRAAPRSAPPRNRPGSTDTVALASAM